MTGKPNIIMFITHDQGQFLRCFDSPQTPNALNTPNLDDLAKDGIRFTNYFCTAPQCSPSRGGIQTGLYPHQNGLMGLVNRGWNLPFQNKTIPMYLKEYGYTTHLVGLQHETNYPENLGYDSMSKRMGDHRYSIRKLKKEFLKFIESHKSDNKPFYANFGTIEVHRTFSAWADPVDPQIVKVPPFLPDQEPVRTDLADFYGAIEKVDKLIGDIIYSLEDNQLRDNTLFIYTTDHGSAFPRAKCTLYDPGIKILLIMNQLSSNIFSGGKIFNQLISNIDLLPTLIEVAGGKTPKDIEGKSFISLLKSETNDFREEIFTEKTYHEKYDPIRGIRTDKFKYIFNFEPLNTSYQIPIDILNESSGKYVKETADYNIPRPQEELYDLAKDPKEMNNLIGNDNYNTIKTELKERLFAFLKRTNDPILYGRIKPQDSVEFKY